MLKGIRATAFVAFAATAALAPAAGAAVEEYQIDANHSMAAFSIRHFFGKVPGRFQKLSGTIAYDPADLATAKVKAELDAASIDTAVADRDKHLRSADFFDVEKFPKITFESTAAKASGKDDVVLTGNLTMHGVTKPVELKVTRLGAGPVGKGKYKAGFEGSTTLNRKDFGIVWNNTLDSGGTILGDDVMVTINIEALRQDAAAAPGAAASPAKK